MTPVAIGDIQRTQGTRKTCIMPKNRYRHLLLCLHRYITNQVHFYELLAVMDRLANFFMTIVLLERGG